MKRLFFRKKQHLISNDQFRAVLSRKCPAQNGLARLYIAENSCEHPRIGISVSKTCGNAVIRNRIKRLIRQAFRINQHDIPQEYDYLLIFSLKMSKKSKNDYAKKVSAWSQKTVERDFLALVDKAVKKAQKNG